MKFDKSKKIKYLDFIIAVALAYVLIKLIDNYTFFASGFNKIISIISPFIFAFIIAYILNPIMKFFEKRFKLKRSLSIVITYIIILGVLAIFIIYLLPKIYYSIIDIVKNIPEFATKADIWLNNILKDEKIQKVISSTGNMNFNTQIIVSKVSDIAKVVLNTLLSKTISFTSYFIKWIFGLIISIYVLYDKEKICEAVKKFIYIVLKKKNGNRVINVFKSFDYMIGIYIGTKAIDSLIIAVIAFIGLTIIGSEYTLLIAVIVGVTNMIPYFGPFIGILVGFIINIFFNPFKAFIVMIFLFLLQQFDGWYLDPKLIGGRVGLSPFLIIFAVTVGGGFYGPIGMLLAVPTMAVIKAYIDKYLAIYNKNMDDKNKKVMDKEEVVKKCNNNL